MASLISNISIIFLKEFMKLNVILGSMIRKVKLVELNISIPTVFSNINFKSDLTEYKCCNNSYQRKFDEKLKERIFNTYKFANHDNDKFILLLREGGFSIWMIGKNSMKHHYLEKKIFTVT